MSLGHSFQFRSQEANRSSSAGKTKRGKKLLRAVTCNQKVGHVAWEPSCLLHCTMPDAMCNNNCRPVCVIGFFLTGVALFIYIAIVCASYYRQMIAYVSVINFRLWTDSFWDVAGTFFPSFV